MNKENFKHVDYVITQILIIVNYLDLIKVPMYSKLTVLNCNSMFGKFSTKWLYYTAGKDVNLHFNKQCFNIKFHAFIATFQ